MWPRGHVLSILATPPGLGALCHTQVPPRPPGRGAVARSRPCFRLLGNGFGANASSRNHLCWGDVAPRLGQDRGRADTVTAAATAGSCVLWLLWSCRYSCTPGHLGSPGARWHTDSDGALVRESQRSITDTARSRYAACSHVAGLRGTRALHLPFSLSTEGIVCGQGGFGMSCPCQGRSDPRSGTSLWASARILLLLHVAEVWCGASGVLRCAISPGLEVPGWRCCTCPPSGFLRVL